MPDPSCPFPHDPATPAHEAVVTPAVAAAMEIAWSLGVDDERVVPAIGRLVHAIWLQGFVAGRAPSPPSVN